MTTSAIAINADTPKNGPRHEIEPSTPPTSGPTAIPSPSAASYRMIACATDPRAELTMVASAVAMNKALPRPHSARQPTMPITVSDMPASPAPAMMTTRPSSSVRLGPIRLATTPVTSMATPITAM